MFQILFLFSYFVSSVITLSRNPPASESFVKFKRGLEFGDVSYSYAHTDFSDRSGSNVKTTTVVRRIGSPKINDKIPQNMIKMPNGHTVQYWPADMDPQIQTKIKNPIKEALNEESYGHLMSYMTNHEEKGNESKKKDEVQVVYKKKKEETPAKDMSIPKMMEKEIISDIVGTTNQDTSPVQFPINEANMKAMMRQQVAIVGTRLQSLPPPPKPNNNKKASSNIQFRQQLPDIFVPPVGNYDEFLANCYRLSKEGNFAFSVPPNKEFMDIASALSAGDIIKVKELANNLKVPEPEPIALNFDSQRFIAANNGERHVEYLNSIVNEAPIEVSSVPSVSVASSTMRAAYVAPRVRLRKRINRRPKIPERMLLAARTTEAPVMAEIVTETNVIANSTGAPQQGTRRRYYSMTDY